MSRASAGFTLLEMMIVLTIIGVVTVIAITNQGSFNKTLILTNTAYDIALTLRSAQSFGLGSRATTGLTNAGYGIHFTTGNSFILFADINPPNASGCHGLPPSGDITAPDARPGNCIYDSSPVDEKVPPSPYILGNGIYIQDFCAYLANGSPSCAVAHNGGLSFIDIVFARPNPDVFITVNGSAGSSYASACLTIASPSAPDGPYRSVTVSPAGAIAESSFPCL